MWDGTVPSDVNIPFVVVRIEVLFPYPSKQFIQILNPLTASYDLPVSLWSKKICGEGYFRPLRVSLVIEGFDPGWEMGCLLYTSDAADE